MEPMVWPIRPSLINWCPFSWSMVNVIRMRTSSPLLALHHLHNDTGRIPAHLLPKAIGLGGSRSNLHTTNVCSPNRREEFFSETGLTVFIILGSLAP